MIDFVINEKAGAKRSARAKSIIASVLEEKGIEYTFHDTKYHRHAIEITKELCKNGATTIVAVGGDGTVNEVLNGLDDLSVRFGIIPCGSGNDFVDTIGIPTDVKKALEIIIDGESKPTDFLVCDGIRGMNGIGTGIDVEILKRCERSKILKGKLKYFISLLISLIKFKFYKFKLDDENAPEQSALILYCGNGRKFGGGIPICPTASVADGKMDFMVIYQMNRLALPIYLVKLMKGKILEQKFCKLTYPDRVNAVFENPISVEIDGEIYENIKFDVHIEKGKLNMFRP